MSGPAHWHNWFPVATGRRQSPVDITLEKCTNENNLQKLRWNYRPVEGSTLVNTGTSWKLNLESEGSSLSSGPLEDEYKVSSSVKHIPYSFL